MNKADKYYIDNLNKIINEGTWDENPRPKYKDDTPAHTKFITGVFEEYDLSKNEFPITTLRNTATKTGIKEIFWIYQKQSNSLDVARDLGIKWWDEWDVGNGTIGSRYGFTVKRYDLMNKLLDGLKNNPFSRRHIIDMFQYQDLEETDGLYPCAYSTSWSVRKVDGVYYLDMTLNQRSNDYIMAGFINKIQYVAFQMMVVGHLNKHGMKTKLGKFCHLVQNLHVYDRHLDALQEILKRDTLDINPHIVLNENKDFYNYSLNDFIVKDIKGIEKLKSALEIAI